MANVSHSPAVVPERRIPAWLSGDNLTTLTLVGSFLLLCFIFATQSENFLSLSNLENISKQLAVVGVVSIGMTIVLISGGVDLSVGSVAALSGVITSLLWIEVGIPLVLATLLGLLSGTLVGFLNGFMVTFMKINPLITTLGTFSIVRGLAFVLSAGQTNQLNDEVFKFLGRGEVFGVSFSLVLMLVLYSLFLVVMRYTQFGRNLYAIGGSPDAARLAGIAVTRHLLIAYTLCGTLAALSGLIIASQLASSAPRAAVGLEFTVITAVILGGTSLAGGKGTLLGTLVGVIILRTLNNGMTITNVASWWQDVASGTALILAVGFDQIRIRLSAASNKRST
ncbi:MAG: ABC transporter permease [Phototrophicaceae bacterium]